MMFDILGKYQASFFVNATDIIPSPEIISALLNMFSDKGFLPTTFQEIGPQGLSPQARLRLNSENNEWGINFASHRINIEKTLVVAGRKIGDVETFAKDAKDFFSRILGHFNKRGHRLSIVTSGVLQEMTHEQLAEIYTKLFQPIPFYEQAIPFEWNSKSASRSEMHIGESLEPINVITGINRVSGQLAESTSVTKFDRILVAFDINTRAENDDNRFTAESLNDFFANALQVRSAILDQIRSIVYE